MNSAAQYEFHLTADSFTPSQAGTGGINLNPFKHLF